MKVQYQITMEVEIEVDNPNDKVTNNWARHNLAMIAATGFEGREITVNKIEVVRTGVTGILPRVVHSHKTQPTDSKFI